MNTKYLLFWGTHSVFASLNNPNRKVHKIFVSKQRHPMIFKTLHGKDISNDKVKILNNKEFDSFLGKDVVHQGIAAYVYPLSEFTFYDLKNTNHSRIVILDQITDPYNVGAIWRSAAAFGIDAIVMTKMNSPSLEKVVAKSAAGALEKVPSILVSNLANSINILKKMGYFCIGLDEEGEKYICDVDKHSPLAIILGSEGNGIRQLTRKLCDQLVKIDTYSNFTTLNVSNAAAVAFYEFRAFF